ncbi:unnamed protein product [Lactuca saligna]|uniref:Poly A polymerase head domain-containing protein n=1 Tax=Lactuca saligna TaxID=75948 RepID=A0AA36E5F6_LACSI|nr:unnamed protein product [Lactuca saligna]
MQFGSPEEDAYRRDLTINTLFYNIHTCLVEDFTKRGLDDLKFGKIVTPLPPKVTFLDDPLRVLRAIRFSTRFGFEMLEELKVAALDNDVKSAILGKVSRERIAFEIDLMLKASDARDVMRLDDGVEKFLCLIPFVLSNEDMNKNDLKIDLIEVPVKLKSRILLGLVLREMKDLWRVALMLSSIVGGEVEKRKEVFMEVEKEILKLGLDKVWEVKHLVDGNDIMRHLELEKSGPVVKKWLRNLRQWQLAYRYGSVEEYFDWMKSQMEM